MYGLLACASVPASAAAVLDQSQTAFDQGAPFAIPTTGPMGVYYDPNLPLARTFTAGVHGILDTVRLFSNGEINVLDGPSTVTLEVRDAGNTLLGSITQAATNVYYGGLAGVDIDVSSLGITVFNGLGYSFGVTAATGDFYTRGILRSSADPYAGGRQLPTPLYGDEPQYDLTFQTLVTPVPEPGSWVLLVAGFSIAGTRLRRRRVAAA